MIVRSVRIVAIAMVALVAAAALALGLAAWRLSTGPLSLDFLTPYLEASFAGNERGITVDAAETVLSWEGSWRTLDLRARDVRIFNPDGTTIAAVPEVSIALSLTALLRGMVAATEVEVVDARVTLVRDDDGRFALATEGAAETVSVEDKDPEFSAVLPAVVDLFTQKPDRTRALDYLDAVRVVDGQLIVIDRRMQTLWFAPDAEMEMRRHERGVAAFLGLRVAMGEELADATLAVLFDQPQETVSVAARLVGFHADAVAAVAPLPDFVSGLHIPIEAEVEATLTPLGEVTRASFDIAGGAGEVSAPPYLPVAKPLTGVRLRGQFEGAEKRFEISEAKLDFGDAERAGPSISLTGAAMKSGEDVEISAEAEIAGLPAAELTDYWPETAVPDGRAWVAENITAGQVDTAAFALSARVPGGRAEAFELVSLDGSFDFQDLAVHYLRPLPPITAIAGRARLEGTDLTFEVAQGREGELSVEDTRVEILDMADDARIEIGGTVTGGVRPALELLGHERLDLLQRVGLDPTTATGEAETQLAIRFPLVSDLSLENVAIEAQADVRQGGVSDFLLGSDAEDMDLKLAVDTDGLALEGSLRLAGVPAVMDWREDFSGEPEVRTRLKLDLPDVDSDGRRALGMDLTPYVEGPVSVAAIATVAQDDIGTINVAANLGDAELALPFLRWQKPSGQNGTLRLSLRLEGEEIASLDGFDLSAGTLLARGNGDLLDGGPDFRSLRFDELAFHGTTLRGAQVTRVGDGFAVDLGAGVLDAAPFLADPEPSAAAGGSDATEEGSAGSSGREAAEPLAEEDAIPLSIEGRALDSLYFAEGRYLSKADLALARSEAGWEEVRLHGEVPEALWRRRADGTLIEGANEDEGLKTFDLTFGPSTEGGFRLDARMNDMGAGLRALGIIDTVEGGALEVTGTTAGPVPAHPLEAHIEAQDYLLREAPTMAQLLSLASFTGISDVLSGDGLQFKRLTGDFTLHHGVVESDLIRAYGNALGLTGKGTLDFNRDAIEVEGTVVPAYTVNSIIGEIPLLGPLLVGGEGEGFVAVVYGIDGKLSDPEVSVNPLSVLTPGFLRGVFGISGGDGDEDGEAPRAMPGRHKG